MEKTECLVREYEQITTQIVHWDSLTWRTSQFFLAVEGLFLAGIGRLLYAEFEKPCSSHPGIVALLLGGALFNLLLCLVWFLVNRRSREYLDVRFKRAREIESDPAIPIRLYTLEREELSKPEYKGHSTRNIEKHIPTIFMVGWVGIISATIVSLF